MPKRFQQEFPEFYQALVDREGAEIEQVLPPATDSEIAEIERRCGVPLPDSYKRLLRCARGFWLLGGSIQFGPEHPFFHDFPALEDLTPQQRQVVARKGGGWPPASQGMLCFAEFFMEADGDQVLWDVSPGLRGGEYSIYYYAHEARPPSVRKLADSFEAWLGQFLRYREFVSEDED
jgi:hypothetical protein